MTGAGVPAARWGETSVPHATPAQVPAARAVALHQLASAISVDEVAHAAVSGGMLLADARGVAVTVLTPGARGVLLHTDGLPDRLGIHDGDDRLIEVYARAATTGSAAETVRSLVVALHANAGTHDDDAAVAVLRVP